MYLTPGTSPDTINWVAYGDLAREGIIQNFPTKQYTNHINRFLDPSIQVDMTLNCILHLGLAGKCIYKSMINGPTVAALRAANCGSILGTFIYTFPGKSKMENTV